MTSFKDWIRKKAAHWLIRDRQAYSAPLFDFGCTRAALRPGDVLLVEGQSRLSTVIKHFTHSPWTHAALHIGTLAEIDDPALRDKLAKVYTGDPHEPLLIESLLGEGTIVIPVNKYRNNHLRICRPIDLSSADSQRVISYMANCLGSHYNTRELLESALSMVCLRLPTGLTSRWLAHKARRREAGICSSMLGHAFLSVRFPVLPVMEHTPDGEQRVSLRAFQILAPRDFDHSPSFEIIKCLLNEELRRELAEITLEMPAPPPLLPQMSRNRLAIPQRLRSWLKRFGKNRKATNSSMHGADSVPPD